MSSNNWSRAWRAISAGVIMNSQEFVNVVKLVVRDAAVADVLSVLDAPPGRRPNEALVKL
jgi:hypothetical protein